jgi:hypothetical protein
MDKGNFEQSGWRAIKLEEPESRKREKKDNDRGQTRN